MKSPTVLFLFIVKVVSVPSLFLTVTVLLPSPNDKSPNVVLLVIVTVIESSRAVEFVFVVLASTVVVL